MKIEVIFFNKYVVIPKNELEEYEHNNIDDILTITLKNKQVVTINNFTFDDFNQITYRDIEVK